MKQIHNSMIRFNLLNNKDSIRNRILINFIKHFLAKCSLSIAFKVFWDFKVKPNKNKILSQMSKTIKKSRRLMIKVIFNQFRV